MLCDWRPLKAGQCSQASVSYILPHKELSSLTATQRSPQYYAYSDTVMAKVYLKYYLEYALSHSKLYFL